MKKLIQMLIFSVLLMSTSNANTCESFQTNLTKTVSAYNTSNTELAMVLFQQNLLIKCQQDLMMKALSDLHTKVDASIDLNSKIGTNVSKLTKTITKLRKGASQTKTNSFGTGY